MTELTALGSLERLGRQFAHLEEEGVTGRRTRRAALAITAAAIVVVLVAASLTPPGRAVAGRIGELVGIGDEPTGLPNAGQGDSVVIGIGEGPSGTGYEIYATTVLADPGDEAPLTCIGLNVPDSEHPPGASCLTPENKRALERQAALPIAVRAPTSLEFDGAVAMQGLAREDAAAVEVSYATAEGMTREAPVEVFSLDDALGTEIDAAERSRYFIGFLPADIVPSEPGNSTRREIEENFSRVRIRVLDANGGVLLDSRYTDLPLPGWWAQILEPPIAPGRAVPVPPPATIREDSQPAD
jgi:hypothetical protein